MSMADGRGGACSLRGRIWVWPGPGLVTKSRVMMSLSFNSESLEWKQRSVDEILCQGRARDGGEVP